MKNTDNATNILSKKTNKMSDRPPPCGNTCHLTPQIMISLSSVSPPLHSPGRTYSPMSIVEDDARILMMPVLPPLSPLDDDERNRKNFTTRHHLKMRIQTHSEEKYLLLTEYSYASKVATDPSNSMNTMILRKDERSCGGNESTDFSVQLFRPNLNAHEPSPRTKLAPRVPPYPPMSDGFCNLQLCAEVTSRIQL